MKSLPAIRTRRISQDGFPDDVSPKHSERKIRDPQTTTTLSATNDVDKNHNNDNDDDDELSKRLSICLNLHLPGNELGRQAGRQSVSQTGWSVRRSIGEQASGRAGRQAGWLAGRRTSSRCARTYEPPLWLWLAQLVLG